ncbi:MAG: hypothetical protein ACOCWI_03065 [Bacillota bacterium]
MSNFRCEQTPARFCNTVAGKSERVCVEVKRIFDACLQRKSIENAQLTVAFPCPPPRCFTVESVSNNGLAIVSNLEITPLPRSACSRVRYTITIPIQVVLSDNAGNTVIGTSSYTMQQDLLLRVPASTALVPVTVEASANVVGLNNTLSDSVLTTTLCITIVTKVLANVIISIPTYGYPCIPPCQEYSEDVCEEIFNRPLYPSSNVPLGFEEMFNQNPQE